MDQEGAGVLARKLFAAVVDSPPLTVRDGGMIRKGVRADLDELIDLSENAQELLLQFETREKEQTRISSLKVRYNNVFGYYIELTKSHAEKAPPQYRRKQTLTNAERFTTPELQALEEKILSARSRRAGLEYEIYWDLRREVLQNSPMLLEFSRRSQISTCSPRWRGWLSKEIIVSRRLVVRIFG